MDWTTLRNETRKRHIERFDEQEAAAYAEAVGRLTATDKEAYLADLRMAIVFREGMRFLDVGAGSGSVCSILSSVPGLSLTALEPSPAMLSLLQEQAELESVRCVCGRCDLKDDKRLFEADTFDVIISRQLFNGLFDPIVAFENWMHWLAPNGLVVLMDGLYSREAWRGPWADDVDALPVAATQSMATAPYLLEHVGFEIVSVGMMSNTNQLAATRTPRYMVVAKKTQAVS